MPAKDDVEGAAGDTLWIEVLFDPVCGEEIADASVALTVPRNGKRFYFCSERCRARFLLDPQRYTVSFVEVK